MKSDQQSGGTDPEELGYEDVNIATYVPRVLFGYLVGFLILAGIIYVIVEVLTWVVCGLMGVC